MMAGKQQGKQLFGLLTASDDKKHCSPTASGKSRPKTLTVNITVCHAHAHVVVAQAPEGLRATFRGFEAQATSNGNYII